MEKHRVMVVDDSRIVYMEMSRMLEDTEFEIVSFCRSGEEALERYEAVAPDVVTVDIVMPGMSGLETAEAILEKWSDANVYMVSSMAYEDMINSAAKIGAKGFLFKPFTRESLLKGLHGALDAAESK